MFEPHHITLEFSRRIANMIGRRIPTADSPMPKIIFATPLMSFFEEVFEGVDVVLSDRFFLFHFDDFLCEKVTGDHSVPRVSCNSECVVEVSDGGFDVSPSCVFVAMVIFIPRHHLM